MPPFQILGILVLGISGISGILGIPVVPALGRSPTELPAPARPTPPQPCSVAAPSWLCWVPFRGHLPPDAVSNWNRRSGRREFVCSTQTLGCNLGSFDPERGPFCFFPWSEMELSSAHFQLLLNPGGFEALDWVDASFGGTPEGAVEGCPLTDIFVGRSPEGLGKASKEQQALFVAVDGEEIWYKWYQVLVVRQGPADLSIADVSYAGGAALESAEEVTLAEVLTRNDGCEASPKSVLLEEATEVERSWNAELPALAAARGVLRASPLLLADSGGWHLGNVTAVPWAGGASATEFVSRSHRFHQPVPARRVLRGSPRRPAANPCSFLAWLTREFRSGSRHRVVISGWAQSRAVTGVRAHLQRCRHLAELPPCPT